MTQFKRFPLVSMMALGMALPALAQTPPAKQADQTVRTNTSGPQAPAADRNSSDVIVVTANKREESVQDIAVAVTAISSAERDQIGLTTVQDYTNFAPGLSYSTSNDRLGMRGVTRTSNNFGIRSGISNYVDGVYFSSAIPASREPIFIDRVEVVRGPQGTLYGRDSIGGALNVISKRPSSTFETQVNIGVDNWDGHKFEARVSGPITDWLRYSVAGSTTVENRGWLRNYSGLTTEGGRRNDSYYEAQLAGNIGDKFDWWIRGGTLSWDVRYGAPGARTAGDNGQPYDTRLFTPGAIVPNGLFGFSGQATNVSMTGTQTTNPAITDPNAFNTDFSNFAYLAPTQEYALEGIYHFKNFDVKYLGGYVWYHYNLQQDNDGSPVAGFDFNGKHYATQRVSDYNENRMWYSNEINIVSTNDSKLQWILGAYQYQENYTQPIYVSNTTNLPGPILGLNDILAFNFANPLPDLPDFTGRNSSSGSQIGGDLYFHTNNQGLNNAYGAFVQGDYSFNDHWKLTAGVRWSKDVMNGREYARLQTLYATEETLEAAFAPYAGLFGGQAVLNALIPPRIDVTSTLVGPDPTTRTTANPCGFAGKGVKNTNVTTANSDPAQCASGTSSDPSRYGVYIDSLTGNYYRDLGAGWSEVTGVLGIDWTPDTDTLVYAKYNRGYKPGGLGAAATFGLLLATPYTDKEIVDSFSGGLKREWRNLNLTTNVEAFYYNYKGYQVPNLVIPETPAGATVRPQPYTPYLNIPKTAISGIELETTWRPLDDLRILFNYGYTNPEIKESPTLISAVDPYALDPGAQPVGLPVACTPRAGETRCRQGQTVKGDILPNSPKNKIALNGVYTSHFMDGSKLDTSLSYFWQDISYTSIFNRWTSKVPSWDQWDGRLSWTSADNHFTVIAYGKNIFDTAQYDSAGASLREGDIRDVPLTICGSTAATSVSHAVVATGDLANSCLTTNATYRPPRTYGIEFQFHF